MDKNVLYRKLSAVFLLCFGFVAFGQTNYPPAGLPWSAVSTNWVYDCSFQGYANQNPSAPDLPCGWYDEPTNLPVSGQTVQTFPLPVGSLQVSLLIVYQYVTPLAVAPGSSPQYAPYTAVELAYTNFCEGSNYEMYCAENGLNGGWTDLGYFTADTNSPYQILQFSGWPSQLYFRIYGQPLPVTVYVTNSATALPFNGSISPASNVCTFTSGLETGSGLAAIILGYISVRRFLSLGDFWTE